MPRGGSRPGAGRKPKTSKVVGMDGKPRGDVLPPAMLASSAPSSALAAEPSELTEPPTYLEEPRKAFWRQWAPLAVSEGTLTKATVLGFEALSRQYVIVQDLALTVSTRAHGWESALAPLFKAEQRLDSTMARFKLTALGKSAAPTRPKAASNPWAALGGPAAKR